jgi:surface carbohydrate biosynthesis protein
MIIYFHIDELNRDSIVASALKSICTSNGWTLVYGNRRTKKLLCALEVHFDFIILPKPHFIKALFSDKQVLLMKRKIIILYTENIGIIADVRYPKVLLTGALNSEFMSGDTKYVEKVAAFCFWGRQVKELVVDHFPNLGSICHVVGHPRHNNIALKNKLNQKQISEKSIGIVTRFNILNDYQNVNPAFYIKNIQKSKQTYEFMNLATNEFLKYERRGSDAPGDIFNEAIDMHITLELITLLASQGKKVSLKIHPRENSDFYRNFLDDLKDHVEIEDPFTPFVDWAIKQTYIIGAVSTSFYDCYMLNILPISTIRIDSDRMLRIKSVYDENNNLMNHVYCPQSFKELLDYVEIDPAINLAKSFSNPDLNKILNLETNYPNQEESLINLVDIIKNLSSFIDISSRNKTKVVLIKTLSYFYYEISYVFYTIKKLFPPSNSPLNSSNFFLNFRIRKQINKLIKI